MTTVLTVLASESKVVNQNYPENTTVSEKKTVKCKECGIERRRLGAHLKASHQMTPAEYQTKYPDALVDAPGSRKRSDACRAKQAAAAKRRWAKKEERKKQSERLKAAAPWKGKKLSEEHKAAISAGGLGKKHELTPEDRKSRGERGRKALEKVRADPLYSEKLSAALRRRHQQGKIGLADLDTWAKGYETQLKNGTLNPPGIGRGITGFRKDIPHYCRSTMEANFARILIAEGIPYEYEPKVFKLPSGKTWTPDFRLLKPLGDIPAGWVELKGWRHKDGSLPLGASEKVAEFEKMVGEPVFVLCQQDDDWKDLREAHAARLAWEKPRRNLRTHPELFGRS